MPAVEEEPNRPRHFDHCTAALTARRTSAFEYGATSGSTFSSFLNPVGTTRCRLYRLIGRPRRAYRSAAFRLISASVSGLILRLGHGVISFF